MLLESIGLVAVLESLVSRRGAEDDEEKSCVIDLRQPEAT